MPPETKDDARGSLQSILQVAGGLIALSALLPLLGVVVRWLAFSLDPNVRGAASLALQLPPPELAFVGGRMLLSLPTSFFAAFLLIVYLAFGSRIDAGRRMRAAGRRIEERGEQIEKLAGEVSREVISPSPARTRLDLLRDDLLQARQIGTIGTPRGRARATARSRSRCALTFGSRPSSGLRERPGEWRPLNAQNQHDGVIVSGAFDAQSAPR